MATDVRGFIRCTECTHYLATHRASGGPCRLNGCTCGGFVGDIPAAAPDEAPGARRVAIDIPEGYMVTISLVPWVPDEEQLDAQAEAVA